MRDSYVLFSISAKEPISNYRLAVKETGTAAPTPAELTLAGLKRNLDTTAINVLIAQRLNAPMIAFAKNYFSDNAQQTLGANMSKHLYLNNFGLIYDDSATGTEAWIKESILKASTGYTLYGMKEGENQVKVLQTFVTDVTLELPTTGEKYSFLDSTLEKDHIEIAINANELYIFPLQIQMKSSATVEALGLAYYIQEQSTNPEEYTHLGSNIVTIPNNIDEVGSLFGDEDPDITNVLLLFRSMESREESYVNGGTYVLINTIHNPNSFHYGIEYSITGSDPRASLKPSVLMKQ